MVSGVRCQITENSLPFVVCHLASVLCIFLTTSGRQFRKVGKFTEQTGDVL
jgi:type III secretory pathway component EscS